MITEKTKKQLFEIIEEISNKQTYEQDVLHELKRAVNQIPVIAELPKELYVVVDYNENRIVFDDGIGFYSRVSDAERKCREFGRCCDILIYKLIEND